MLSPIVHTHTHTKIFWLTKNNLRIGKQWPMEQIWSTTCFCRDCKTRMFSFVCKRLGKNKKKNIWVQVKVIWKSMFYVCKQSFIGRHPHQFTYILSVDAFNYREELRSCQGDHKQPSHHALKIASNNSLLLLGPTKSKIFTMWTFAEKIWWTLE